ncbi:hypothetical protein WALSEDRAFT_64829 [Wallemia mellicola CBS 633.66]|uniref:Uncharacterized protein n=1 Tax=Wallemia mellicola (strain ATCC MYA-4683 / CBS 633.66) TaxID=671144 RepID=I4YAE2_WALMC|nr:hypothetical protein WALSEDRAFT_64829 [Wallemia mellicola CBS 633.66]EIM20934.1 hypothetical protein WALSEDRAFT_64829 [Wallemia mellicola CBS 633.66]TIC49117.1 hypothetical protein E3Q05_03915 [Wallemia mellicola]|eukprot:XP_006958929.1 hypothetical protein WALSEDRAFT_64829 [Wallemia mellicola CBS 633.66]
MVKQFVDINILLVIAVAILSLFIVSPYVLNNEAQKAASVSEREAKVAERESLVASRETALYWKSIPPPEEVKEEETECITDQSLVLRELELTRWESTLNKRESNLSRRESWLIENWPKSD